MWWAQPPTIAPQPDDGNSLLHFTQNRQRQLPPLDYLGVVLRERDGWLGRVPAATDQLLRNARTPQELMQLLRDHIASPDERTDPEEVDALGREFRGNDFRGDFYNMYSDRAERLMRRAAPVGPPNNNLLDAIRTLSSRRIAQEAERWRGGLRQVPQAAYPPGGE